VALAILDKKIPGSSATYLIDYLVFYIPLKNFSLIYGDDTTASEELQNLGLCSALRVFE
jgi:hypothetical protein